MNHQHWIVRLACGVAVVGFLTAAPVSAQDAEQRRQEIQERIGERFTILLRSELALSDRQAEAVIPAIEELEQLKTEMGRERRETVRELQTGMREGTSDRELQFMLDRLENIDDRLRVAEREALLEIDAELNTRQRVKLRFFVQRFRTQIRDRMSDRMRHRRKYERPRSDRP